LSNGGPLRFGGGPPGKVQKGTRPAAGVGSGGGPGGRAVGLGDGLGGRAVALGGGAGGWVGWPVGVGSGEPAVCGGRGRPWAMIHAALAASASSNSSPNPLRNNRTVRFIVPPPLFDSSVSSACFLTPDS
jgi:hypothetical protein